MAVVWILAEAGTDPSSLVLGGSVVVAVAYISYLIIKRLLRSWDNADDGYGRRITDLEKALEKCEGKHASCELRLEVLITACRNYGMPIPRMALKENVPDE